MQRGVFPEWEKSIWGLDEHLRPRRAGRADPSHERLRNCNVTTVAPTGTISIIAGCSSGIEPLFAVAFMRNQAGVADARRERGLHRASRTKEGWYSRRADAADRAGGPYPASTKCRSQWQRVFVTANDITPEWHIRMQAAFQEYNDSAISKTVQLRPRRHRGVTSRRSTGSPTSSAARASRSIATAAATCRCCRPARRRRRSTEQSDRATRRQATGRVDGDRRRATCRRLAR